MLPRLLWSAPPAAAAAAPTVRLPQLSMRKQVVKCMAKERRVRMVAKQIQRELSEMLSRDTVMRNAVQPEASLGADRYLSSLTTISDVELSNDLQVCWVYISVFGDERGKEVALTGLQSISKYVRKELCRRVKLRLAPEIRFVEDEAAERGSRVLAILDSLKEERKQSGEEFEEDAEEQKEGEGFEDDEEFEEDGGDIEPSNVSGEDNWDKDEPDEGIIYIK